ncbi:homocysteine S-methyltransferase family protein [Opitutus sp. ER46]|uniref:homocysteine S-methyltransferase family protein n=1 Tax=Opitutus sp. ER46 TaxID=2161864 RepID=UPI000D322370|nr:homocysteine S-methyltransferase family protein [Opitutus sp. ER46]PTX91567.1 homocysteine methyltransferase [Opitutus sp. ER46]
MTLLHDIIRTRRLVCDGAMGTQLMLAGLEQGACGEAWNLTHPDRVLAIQRRYVEAGADCIITNTFGASRIGLAKYGLEKDLAAINRAGARLAREAFGGKPGFVLGDIGPLGVLLEPYGDLSLVDASAALLEQAKELVAAGVDAVIIETQTALEELGLAIDAAKQAGAACIIGSVAFDRAPDGKSFRTMMGVSPEQAVEVIVAHGAHIVALNCGAGMDMPAAAEVAALFRQHCALPIMVQPNAGQPVLEQGRLVYRQLPADMAKAVPAALAAGAAIVGSCCGSTPDHTRAIRAAVDAHAAAR